MKNLILGNIARLLIKIQLNDKHIQITDWLTIFFLTSINIDHQLDKHFYHHLLCIRECFLYFLAIILLFFFEFIAKLKFKVQLKWIRQISKILIFPSIVIGPIFLALVLFIIQTQGHLFFTSITTFITRSLLIVFYAVCPFVVQHILAKVNKINQNIKRGRATQIIKH